MKRILLPLGILIVLTGCRAHRDQVPTVVTRDSAGVRIVENRGDIGREALPWRISDSPVTDIGGTPDSRLYRVMSAARSGNGHIHRSCWGRSGRVSRVVLGRRRSR